MQKAVAVRWWWVWLIVLLIVIILIVVLWPPMQNSGVAIVAMMKDPKNLDTWLSRHRRLGIKHFFIRLEDSPDVQDYLNSQHDVTVIPGKSDGVNEYENIQTRQINMVNDVLKMAAAYENPKLGWLIHVDADELVVGDLNALRQQPHHVRTVWFQNVEAKFPDVPDEDDSCFDAAKFINCAEGGCAAYANGKSAGRVAPDVSAHGPHRMKSSMDGALDEKVEAIQVQHYESCDFDSYKKKFKNLAVQKDKEPSNIPFPYYNESIAAARTGDDDELESVYRKYRVA